MEEALETFRVARDSGDANAMRQAAAALQRALQKLRETIPPPD